MACADGLGGFPEAIRAAYPEAAGQLCVVHLVRAALRYTSGADGREVSAGLKAVYRSATAAEAERALGEFARKWTMPIKGWKQALNHFAILFEGRLSAKLAG